MAMRQPEQQKFAFYQDRECTRQLQVIEFPAPVTRGKEKAELTVYARNITNETLDKLNFIPQDPDLKIEQSSVRVEPRSTIMLKFIFTPREGREKALNSRFVINGQAIIKPVGDDQG